MWFWQNAPAEFRPVTAVGVLVDARSTLEPDVVLTLADAPGEVHYLTPDQVVVVVEVVSPGTRRRDRLEKPADYAAAGVTYYWRVEQDPVHVYAYELGPDGIYQPAADSDEELVLAKPFEICLPIAAITPRRARPL
jgi:Uma2 family endonuclease